MNDKVEKNSARWRVAMQLGLSRSVQLRAIKLAAVVGTLLLLINQGDVFWNDAQLNITKAVLTYFVPWGVSTWTSMQMGLERMRDIDNE